MDFTRPATIMDNLRTIAEAGADAVIGTTGITESDIPGITTLYRKHGVNAIISPRILLWVPFYY